MKKLVDRALLAVGLGLAGAGAWWMWTGWDIVQVEKGWASVISGSVMLSGGLVVTALAWAVMRLSAAQPVPVVAEKAPDTPKDSAVSPALVAAGAATAGAAGAIAVSRMRNDFDDMRERIAQRDRDQDLFETSEPKHSEARTEGSGRDDFAPDDDVDEIEKIDDLDAADDVDEFEDENGAPAETVAIAAPAVEAAPPAADLSPIQPPPVEAPRRLSIDELVRRSVAEPEAETKKGSLFARFGRDRFFRNEPAPASAADSEPRDEPDDKADNPFATDAAPSVAPLGPIFPKPRASDIAATPETEADEAEAQETEEARETEETLEEPIAPAPHVEVEREEPVAATHTREAETADAPVADDWFDEAERSLDRNAGSHAPAGVEQDESAAPEPAKAAAVTGRYSSGDTNYTMYDDGSIEAQTPDGTMRFASLIELRRFVEQRR